MSENSTHATVMETGESDLAARIEVSGHPLKGDEPFASCGGNLGPAPYDLLLAALGECTAMTVRWHAKCQHFPLEKVEVKLSYRKEIRDGQSCKTDIFEKQIFLYGDALTPEQCEKLKQIAAKCPVQRTLEGTPLIHTVS